MQSEQNCITLHTFQKGFDNEKDEGITIEKAEENKDLDFSDSELGGVPEEKAKEIIPEISDSDDSDDDALRADKR